MKLGSENYRLKKMARLSENLTPLLDVGCSDMPNTYLKSNEIIGLDLVDKGNLSPNYKELKIGDVYNLPKPFKPSYFKCVIIGEVLEHVENPIEFLRKIKTVMQKDAKLILSTPNPNSISERLLSITLNRKFFYTDEHTILYPQRWLIRIMELAGFKNVKLYSGGIQLPGFDLVPFPRPWCYQTIATGNA